MLIMNLESNPKERADVTLKISDNKKWQAVNKKAL